MHFRVHSANRFTEEQQLTQRKINKSCQDTTKSVNTYILENRKQSKTSTGLREKGNKVKITAEANTHSHTELIACLSDM